MMRLMIFWFWISKIRIIFDEGGVENQHGGGGLLFSRDKDIMGWLFSQKK